MISIKKRLITALFIWLMKWDGTDLVLCKRNDILLDLMNKHGISPEELSLIVNSEIYH